MAKEGDAGLLTAGKDLKERGVLKQAEDAGQGSRSKAFMT